MTEAASSPDWSVSTANAFTFVHFVYRQPVSATRAAESLWRWHPQSNGFTTVDYGGLVPAYAADPRVTLTQLTSRLSARAAGLFLDEHSVVRFVDQVHLALDNESCQEWLLVLEDDVRVLRPIDAVLDFDLNGVNQSENLPIRVNVELARVGRRPRWRGFGGCGGSILKAATLRRRDRQDIKAFLSRTIRRTGRPLGSDEVLSTWVLYCGGRLGGYQGFAETWYPDIAARLSTHAVSVLHQFKDDYHTSK